MLIRTHQDGFIHPLSSEITTQETYNNRRQILRQWSATALATGLAGWTEREAFAQGVSNGAVKLAGTPAAQSSVQGAMTVEKPTSYKDATTYNNFYEFGTDKSQPAQQAHTLKHHHGPLRLRAWLKSPRVSIWKM